MNNQNMNYDSDSEIEIDVITIQSDIPETFRPVKHVKTNKGSVNFELEKLPNSFNFSVDLTEIDETRLLKFISLMRVAGVMNRSAMLSFIDDICEE